VHHPKNLLLMNKEYQHSEIIEAYLRNELSAEQRADFEQLVRQDPLLYNEFLLQKETITSIQSHRKAALKNRLNQIDVSDSNSWNGATSASIWIGGLVLVGMLGWFGYNYFSARNALVLPSTQVAVTKPLITETPSEVTTKDEPVASSTFEGNTVQAASTQNQTAARNTATVRSKASVRRNNKLQEKTRIASKPQVLVDVLPESEISLSLQEEAFRKTDSNAEPLAERPVVYSSGNTASASNRLNVIDNTNDRLKLHYYYRNGRIALLGFDKPYTFLDIPSENVTYLQYEGDFYKLNVHQIQPAPIQDVRVTDEILIDSLKKMLTKRK